MNNIKYILILVFVQFACSCKKDANKNPLIIPSTYKYDSVSYITNVQTEQKIRLQLAKLVTYMKKGDNVANKLELDSLNNYFSDGTPSLKSLTPLYYSNLIENTWFPGMVNASQNNFDIEDADNNNTGGVYYNRLLDSKGIEYLQEIEKGMYAALLYNYFVTISQSNLNETAVDRMVSIYGAHPSFPNTNTLTKTSNPDAYIALYAARRDRSDKPNGIYRQIKYEFLKLKAAIIAGNNYNEEKNEAIAELKLLMEKAIMSTVINYIYSAISKIDITNPTISNKADVLHELSECVGFVHGFKNVPQVHRKITDSQIDAIITLITDPVGADETTMYLYPSTPTLTILLQQAQTYIKNIYRFTSAEMTDFNYNWIATEGR